jgi:hypothetical protein
VCRVLIQCSFDSSRRHNNALHRRCGRRVFCFSSIRRPQPGERRRSAFHATRSSRDPHIVTLNAAAKWSTIPTYLAVWTYSASYGLTWRLLPFAILLSAIYVSSHAWQIKQHGRCLIHADMRSTAPSLVIMASLFASAMGPKLSLLTTDEASCLMICVGGAMTLGHVASFVVALLVDSISPLGFPSHSRTMEQNNGMDAKDSVSRS